MLPTINGDVRLPGRIRVQREEMGNAAEEQRFKSCPIIG